MSYDAVFLSPHLDDAVYSCGGTISNLTSQGKRVLVLTFTTKEPDLTSLSEFAQHHHDRWLSQSQLSMIETRKAEDIAALQFLGADYLHSEILDCIYRTDSAGNHLYQSITELFGHIHPADSGAIREFAATIEGTVLTKTAETTTIFSPLGVGGHIDHQLVQSATLELINSGDISKHNVKFYEDYPYAEGETVSPKSDSHQWSSSTWPTNRRENDNRAEAITIYASQFADFWSSRNDLATKLNQRWEKYGRAERYWQLS